MSIFFESFGYKDGIFRTTVAVRSEHRQALQELVREIVDWRLAQYLARLRQSEPDPQAPRGFVCKVSHTQGRPILFLPDRATHPWLPSGLTRILTDQGEFEANFVKVALNVVRKAGTYTGENALPDLLRKWFGPDVGKPGTNFEVAFERKGDAWEMKPLRPAKPIDERGNP